MDDKERGDVWNDGYETGYTAREMQVKHWSLNDSARVTMLIIGIFAFGFAMGICTR